MSDLFADLNLTRTARVDVPCRVCRTPVSTMAAFAEPGRAERVVCEEHVPPPDPASLPPTPTQRWAQVTPREFRNVGLDGIPDEGLRGLFTSVASQTDDTLTSRVGGFLLVGPTGTRKTGACYALLNTLVANGVVQPHEILVKTESDWLPEMAANVSRFKDATNMRNTMARVLSGKKILLLDDLGYGQYPSREDQQSVILALMKQVDIKDILLLVTTNLTDRAKMEAWVGHAAFSRLWRRIGGVVGSAGNIDTRLGKDFRASP